MTDVWNIKEILLWSSQYLKQHGCESPRLDSELLMCQALGCTRVNLYCNYDQPVNQNERSEIRKFLKRRSLGEPIAYITGIKEFYGRDFLVNSNVLIPRPETEHLIEVVIALHKENPVRRFLDVGTGSGAIAITLAKELVDVEGIAWDNSVDALDVARANADQSGATLTFEEVDALNDEAWNRDLQVDVVCSNPPYIGISEKPLMGNSVLNYEPHEALFAADDGYAFYRKFADSASKLLREGGACVMEIGASQGDQVKKIFEQASWVDVKVHNDLAGLSRVVVAKLP